MKPIVIIPALNPDEKLIAFVEELKELNLPVVVVNDGSKSECAVVFNYLKNEAHCAVCEHEKNRGKGAALKTGIAFAARKYRKASGYLTADADGQHTAQDLLKVAKMVEQHPDSLVLGTRNFRGANIPFKSLFGNRITSWVFLLSTGKFCRDTQTGLRGIPRKFTDDCLAVAGSRYEYEMNLLLKFARQGTPFIYVPISTIYLDGNRSSHFHAIKDSALIYWNIMKYSFSSMVSAGIDLSLFTVLVHFLFGAGPDGLLAATVLARLLSGTANFWLNRNWVFQSASNQTLEAQKYLTLFCGQMLASWLLVAGLSYLALPLTFVKISADTSLWFISYLIQKKYIFSVRRKGGPPFDENVLYKAL